MAFSACLAGCARNIGTDVPENGTVIDIGIGDMLDDEDVNSSGNTGDGIAVVPRTYSITYNLDGGVNSATNPQKYIAGSTISLEAPSKRAYDFIGWVSKDGEIYETGREYAFSGDLELYAQWRYAPTNEEHLELSRRDDIPVNVALSIQEKIAFDYRALGFEVFTTEVSGCYAVCYYFPDMASEDKVIPCGIVLINYPMGTSVPIGLEIPFGDYTLVNAFESSDDMGQYQYMEDGMFYLYDVFGPYVYIEYYNSAQEVDEAIASGTSYWDLELYSWNYDTNDFLTIPFELIPDYDPTYEWKLFGDYTTTKLIEQIQSLDIIQTATSIETFTGVFLSEELARYVEQCLLNGTDILINGVPYEEVVKLATQEQQAGRIIVIEMDGSIGMVDWFDEWTAADEIHSIEEQVAQLQRQLLLMGATVIIGVVLTPFTGGASLVTSVMVGFAFGTATELLQQVYVEGRDWSELDWGAIGLQGGLGALTAGISVGACTWVQNVARHSAKVAYLLPAIAKGIDLTLDVGATVAYDLAMGYSADQIINDIAMTVVTNAVVSMATSSCFVAGTDIATPDGAKDIEDIRLGDTVYSYTTDGQLAYGTVTKLYHSKAVIWTVLLENGQTVRTTAMHPFYVEGEYVQTKDLQEDDVLLQLDGTEVGVEYVRQEVCYTDVYNFEVDYYHNYFAGGVLVHNNCGPKIEGLLDGGYGDVPHKTNYNPSMADRDTWVYLITVNDNMLDKLVGGRILEVYPQYSGKTYKEACFYVDGNYVLKVGTTVNDFYVRYSNKDAFERLYGLELENVTPISVTVGAIPQKDALMLESELLKNFSLAKESPVPGNSNFVEYTRSTRYDYKPEINEEMLKIDVYEYLDFGRSDT